MEHLANETIHIESHYVMENDIEYLREYDIENKFLKWIKDPCEENGKSEKVEDYTELEKTFRSITLDVLG